MCISRKVNCETFIFMERQRYRQIFISAFPMYLQLMGTKKTHPRQAFFWATVDNINASEGQFELPFTQLLHYMIKNNKYN